MRLEICIAQKTCTRFHVLTASNIEFMIFGMCCCVVQCISSTIWDVVLCSLVYSTSTWDVMVCSSVYQ